MGSRKDKTNHVLKDGEFYREKENRYMFRYQDGTGKRHYVYAKTLLSLREKEKEIRRDVDDGICSNAKSITLKDEYQLWISIKEGLKDTTAVNYSYMAEKFILPIIGDRLIVDIRKSDIRAYYNGLVRVEEGTQTMSIATLEVVNNVLHQVFQVAYDDDIIRKNPVDGVLTDVKKANNFKTPKREALTISEQEAFVAFINGNARYKQWAPMFATFLGTGCRVSELIGLRWCDLDFEKDIISINHNLVYYKRTDGTCGFSVTTTKTEAGNRDIPMLSDVKRALLDERSRQQMLGIKCKTVVDGYSDFVFVNRYNNAHHPNGINRAIKRIIEVYNAEETIRAEKLNVEPLLLPPFSCHSLRHTFCTRLCENEPNIKVIQDIMGHADAQTTLDIYAEVQNELRLETAKKLDGKFSIYGSDTKSDTILLMNTNSYGDLCEIS